MKSVYSAVRTGSLNKAVCASSLKGSSTSLQSLEERINPFDFFLIFIFFFNSLYFLTSHNINFFVCYELKYEQFERQVRTLPWLRRLVREVRF